MEDPVKPAVKAAPPPPPPPPKPASDWRTAGTLRSALIWSEVIGKPVSLRGKRKGR